WVRKANGRLGLRSGSRLRNLATIFANPTMPGIDDYYEPWTYDYQTLTNAPLQEHIPVARPKPLISDRDMATRWSANWDVNLAGCPELVSVDPVLRKFSDQVKLEFEQSFMFYLPRICEHVLIRSFAAACLAEAIYKLSED